MSYLDDYVRDNAALGRTEVTHRMMGAGYDRREIDAAWRRRGRASPAVTPSAVTPSTKTPAAKVQTGSGAGVERRPMNRLRLAGYALVALLVAGPGLLNVLGGGDLGRSLPGLVFLAIVAWAAWRAYQRRNMPR